MVIPQVGASEEKGVPAIDVKALKRALVDAGLEVFRVRGEEVHLAERQNVQLMEAGVRVRGGEAPAVTVVARAQRNDAPELSPETLLDLVRARLAPLYTDGYVEVDAVTREIRSVSDKSQVTDIWSEVTLRRDVASLEEAVAVACHAVTTDRYVVPRR